MGASALPEESFEIVKLVAYTLESRGTPLLTVRVTALNTPKQQVEKPHSKKEKIKDIKCFGAEELRSRLQAHKQAIIDLETKKYGPLKIHNAFD
jgi:hypothetical protein